MKITRETSSERINEIVNHSSIHPWVCGPLVGALDLSTTIANPYNICLSSDHGAMLFIKISPGLYEVHTNVLPGGRGEWCLEFVQGCLRRMFTETDALELYSRVPRGNIAAKALVRSFKWEYLFDRPNSWVMDHKLVSSAIYSQRIDDWIKTDPTLVNTGQWFHDKLEVEYKALGFSHEKHEDNEVHDRWVGATMEMVRGGQPHKGAVIYNKWAAMAGYLPISIVRESPLLVDISEALLMVKNGDFRVISCQQDSQSVGSASLEE